MEQIGILTEQVLSGFVYDSTYGAYALRKAPSPFILEVGKDYDVMWDGTEYKCAAYETDVLGYPMVCIGTAAGLGGADTGEPFVIAYTPSYNTLYYLAATAEESHTVAIYQVVEDENPVGIILRDYKNEETTHYGNERLEVDSTDGGTKLYVLEDLVDTPVEQTVELDFSGGDMVVTPEAGTAFSKITIHQPENLKPENIPQDMDVAGIIGTLVAVKDSAGGGGSLPAGLYWEDVTPKMLNYYYQAWFMYGGFLHSWHSIASGYGMNHKISRLADGVWMEIAGEHSIGGLSVASSCVPVVLGDTVHLIGSEKSVHMAYTFGDSTAVRKSDLPNTIKKGDAFVHNGKLKAYSYYNGNLYVWDESSDSWTVEAAFGGTRVNRHPVLCGADLYFIQYARVYKYTDGALVQVGNLNNQNGTNYVYQNGYIYNIDSNNKVQKYNLSTNVCESIDQFCIMYSYSNAALHVWDNQIHVVEVVEDYRRYYDMVMHEI